MKQRNAVLIACWQFSLCLHPFIWAPKVLIQRNRHQLIGLAWAIS